MVRIKKHREYTSKKSENDKKIKELSDTQNMKMNTKFNSIFLIFILFLLGYGYMNHIETLFENDSYFSHLSTLDRELSFRSEAGLYYYYFKILVSKQTVIVKNKNSLKIKYEYNNENIFKNIQYNIINDNKPSSIRRYYNSL